SLLIRWARTHIPFFSADPATRWGLPVREVEQALRRLAGRGNVMAGEFRPGHAGREYCHPDVLRSLRRKSLAALRREVEPVPVEVLGRFLPSWHGVGIQASGLDRLTEIVFQLQGCAIPASVLERDVLPVRVREYRPQLLDQLISMGEVVWAGEVTNDTFLPLRMLGPRMRRNPRRPLMRLGPPTAAGRWSLVRDLLHPQLSSTEHLHAMAGVLLQRYGVLTREAALGE